MEPEFWHQKWANNDIGFHQQDYHPFLTQYFPSLSLPENARVLVPLCGKTKDMHWLLQQSMQVVGIELSSMAVEQFFDEWGVEPAVTQDGTLKHYQYQNLEIFQGDLFELEAKQLGKVDAVYDRAALVALPKELRKRYSQHLQQLSQCSPQLLICFDYDQRQMNGPPFSVPDDEINEHYAERYAVECLANIELSGGLKGKTRASELVYLLST